MGFLPDAQEQIVNQVFRGSAVPDDIEYHAHQSAGLFLIQRTQGRLFPGSAIAQTGFVVEGIALV
jgi:hypothetical protein